MDALTQAQLSELQAIKERVQALITAISPPEDGLPPLRPIIWGAKVEPSFRAGVLWIEQQLELDADKLMACMAFETGGTFSPTVRNAAGSSAIGLIQFMATTAKQLGTSTEALGRLTATQQLSYVYHYFRRFGGDLSHWSLEDVYMAILYPAAIGKPLDWEMPWKYGSLAYKQNAGLDLNKDHKITKREAAAGVLAKYELGKQFKA